MTSCCLFNLPAECERCGKRAAEDESSEYIWVLETGKAYSYCSTQCLMRSLFKRTYKEIG